MEIEIKKKETKLKEHNLKYLDVGTVLKIDNYGYDVYVIVCDNREAVNEEYCEDRKCLVILKDTGSNYMAVASHFFKMFKEGNYEICGKIQPESKIVVG